MIDQREHDANQLLLFTHQPLVDGSLIWVVGIVGVIEVAHALVQSAAIDAFATVLTGVS